MTSASQLVSHVMGLAADQRDRLVALCEELVAAPSQQPVGNTERPVELIVRLLESAGLNPQVVIGDEGKPNIVCAFEGHATGPQLIFNGHLDTLPPGDEAQWSVPIWEMQRRAGLLTGLGIGNMKAGVAALILAFLNLYEMRASLTGRLVLTLVADEVFFGPSGTAHLLEQLPDLRHGVVINAEGPGDMGLAVAEKGLLWLELEAIASPGQGMLNLPGSSAIGRLSRLVAELDSWNSEHSRAPAEISDLTSHAGLHGLRLSVNPGTIAGGSSISQVATVARCEVDFRVPPGMTIAAIEERVRKSASAIGNISVRKIKGWDPNWIATAHPLAQTMMRASQDVRGSTATPVTRLPASDASRWRALGVPAICYGPQLALASGIDDAVREQDVLDCMGSTFSLHADFCPTPMRAFKYRKWMAP